MSQSTLAKAILEPCSLSMFAAFAHSGCNALQCPLLQVDKTRRLNLPPGGVEFNGDVVVRVNVEVVIIED